MTFEDEAAKEAARKRLLNAAKRFGIVPRRLHHRPAGVRARGREAAARQPVPLPTGFVTMLMTDVEGSTALVEQLGPRYRTVIDRLWAMLTRSRHRGAAGGRDEGGRVLRGVRAAGCRSRRRHRRPRELQECSWPEGVQVRVQAGIHSGYPTTTDDNYIGLPVHAASRICGAAHGRQILVSGDTKEAVRSLGPSGCASAISASTASGDCPAASLFQVAAEEGCRGLPAAPDTAGRLRPADQ